MLAAAVALLSSCAKEGPQGIPGPKGDSGTIGPPGPSGVAGSQIYSGTGAPPAGLDQPGDRFVMSEVTMPYRPLFPVFTSLVGWTFRYKRAWPVRGGDVYNGQSEVVLPGGKPCPK